MDKVKKKPGAKRKKINWDYVAFLKRQGLPAVEVAKKLNISLTTLDNNIKEHWGCSTQEFFRIKVNWNQVDELCKLQCTGIEIAAVLGISYDSLNRACKKEKYMGFAEYCKGLKSIGKVSLRRNQWLSVTGIKGECDCNYLKTKEHDKNCASRKYIVPPNVSMQKFLGKNILEQTENDVITHDFPKDLVFNIIPASIAKNGHEKSKE